jgi:mannitol-1-phosphate/altronate dehydrogenase
MKAVDKGNGRFEGTANGHLYMINDDQADYFAEKWKTNGPETIVAAILEDKNFWGADLTGLNGFSGSVDQYLHLLMKNGVMPVLRRVQLNKTAVG